jgi:hypothetical protein
MLKELDISFTADANLALSKIDSIEGKASTLSGKDTIITFHKGGMFFSVSPTILSIYAADKVIDRISPVINKTLSLLLRNRDFLGHQLNYKSGNLTSQEFEELISEYLPPTIEYDLDELESEVRLLMDISDLTFNSDQLSVMFNCEIDDAERILTALVQDHLNG